ncbi:unnamed protein product [Cunninghamella echinulata]
MSDIVNSMYKALHKKKKNPSQNVEEESSNKPMNQQTSLNNNNTNTQTHLEQRSYEPLEEDHPSRQVHKDQDDYSYGFIIGS